MNTELYNQLNGIITDIKNNESYTKSLTFRSYVKHVVNDVNIEAENYVIGEKIMEIEQLLIQHAPKVKLYKYDRRYKNNKKYI